MFKKAFSLAEVLIVVSIIGIVATLTLPNLTNNYKDEKTVVQLRKIHNDLNSSYKQVILKYGEYENWNSGITNAEKIKRYMEFLDTDRVGSGVKFPFATYNSSSYTKCELKDGTLLSFKNNTTKDASDQNSYFDVFVAVNGIDGNTLGTDVFGFTINPYTQRVDPFGRDGKDVGSNGKLSFNSSNFIYATNWAITNGNMDYLNCLSNLNWNNRLTCK